MIVLNHISDDDLMRLATMIKSNPILRNNYKRSFELIKNSSKFNDEEKRYLLDVLNRMNPDKESFDKKYIGFK